ncbi:MAG: MarR family transcriptional regulator [Bacteroidales bacterium]|nr:MarR family transcriptional regulator [Bacteroidales bacterium]
MSYKIQLLRKLLNYIDLYGEEEKNDSLEQFSIYLKDRVFGSEQFKSPEDFDKEDYNNFKKFAEIQFAIGVTTLFRFARTYVKKAFSERLFKTLDEFGFLSTLLREGSLLKSELIQKHLLEISSGSEIIKRLIRLGLIYEFDDERDRRAKRVALTELGKSEVIASFDEMHKVSEIVIGTLSLHEVTDTLAVFNKLTSFHWHIQETDKNTGLEEIYQKFIETPLS